MALNQTQESVVTVPVRLTSTIIAGQIVTTTNLIGIAMVGGVSGDTVSVAIKGAFVYSGYLNAATGTGDPVYFDASRNRMINGAHAHLALTDYCVGYSAKYHAAGTYAYQAGALGTAAYASGTSSGSKHSAVEFIMLPSAGDPTSTYLR